MAYPPNGFNWNWVDLPTNASLADVISKVNWIGQNLETTFTSWIEANDSDSYTNIEAAKTDASNAQTAAAAAEAKADVATGKISRCSYLRGTH